MPADLLGRWRLFFAHEPWGFRSDWLRTGTVAACVLNTAFGRKAGSKPVAPEAFVPVARPARKPKTWRDELAMFKAWAGPPATTPPAESPAPAPAPA